MNIILPIIIVFALGGLFGGVLHRLRWPLLVRSCAAALLATLVWGCGVCLLLWLVAPNEPIGHLLPDKIALTFLTALPAAMLAGRAPRSKDRD